MTTKHFKQFALSAIIILTASLLSACGGGSSGSSGSNSGSSSGFAPANQNAFNTQFVGQTLTYDNIDTFSILANNKHSSTAIEDGVTITIYGDFNYTKISANKASASIDVDDFNIDGVTLAVMQALNDQELNAAINLLLSYTCTYTMTFTSTLSGTYDETCSYGVTEETYSGNFKFSGSN